MPRIELKPNSPEYDDSKTPRNDHVCEIFGCSEAGEYKAPKTRGLNEYFYFCLEHIRDYNKSWNFFEGMAASEVRDHMLRSLYGDRPTWRHDMGPNFESDLQDKIWETYQGDSQNGQKKDPGSYSPAYHYDSPEYKAMAVLGVEPPLDIKVIKKKYKELARKHHPDHNQGSKESEELLKDVNIAYTILKDAFEKYEELDKA